MKPLLVKLLAVAGLVGAVIWLLVSVSVGIHGETAKWLPAASVTAVALAMVLSLL